MATATRPPSTEEALSFAVRSAQRADMETARAALRWVLRREPENVAAWMWLERVSEDAASVNYCSTRIAELNPVTSRA